MSPHSVPPVAVQQLGPHDHTGPCSRQSARWISYPCNNQWYISVYYLWTGTGHYQPFCWKPYTCMDHCWQDRAQLLAIIHHWPQSGDYIWGYYWPLCGWWLTITSWKKPGRCNYADTCCINWQFWADDKTIHPMLVDYYSLLFPNISCKSYWTEFSKIGKKHIGEKSCLWCMTEKANHCKSNKQLEAVCLFLCLSVWLLFCLSVCLSVCQCTVTYPSMDPSIFIGLLNQFVNHYIPP